MKRGPKPKDYGACAHCGKPLNKDQEKYCSRSCMREAWAAASEAKRRRVCKMCGKEFTMRHPSGKANKGEVEEGQFCSRKCRGQWVSAQAALNTINGLSVRKGGMKASTMSKIYARHCTVCGKAFVSRRSDRKFCSKNCSVQCHQQRKTPHRKLEHKCKQCGKKFIPEYGNKRRAFCSDICLKRMARDGRKAKEKAKDNGVYYEYVNPLKVFKRDGWRCQLCGKKLKPKHRGTIRDDAPELDHIIPWAQGGEHSYRNTQCTCRKCNGDKGSRELGQLRLFG